VERRSFLHFSEICESVAALSSTLDKVRAVATYLVELDDLDLEAATLFLSGRAFAQSDPRSLRIGSATILAAARAVWHIEDVELRRHYRSHGDLGAALAPFTRQGRRLALFAEPLTPAILRSTFGEIAAASGKNAGRRRQVLCEQILGACESEIETKYVVKIMTGDLRIGLREGLVLEGIAEAFDQSPQDVRRAVMASSNIGHVAVAAKHKALESIQIAYGSPIGFMLASPIQYGTSYREFSSGNWILENKYDGIRAQLHRFDDKVVLFSRTLDDISTSYPEIIEAAQSLESAVILDGELIAQKSGLALPFRFLQARLQRKIVSAELLTEVPVTFMFFDILAHEEEFLIDEPLSVRRERLQTIPSTEHLTAAPYELLNTADDAAAHIHESFEKARNAGHEGLLAKRLDARYHPGRRGKWWLKLKRELATLDVVVVAVEWGHGKRAGVLSDYTFAVRTDSGELMTLGKAYSGLTDAEIASLTKWFLDHRLPPTQRREKARAGEIPVQPALVIEVAFDIIQRSDLHESGFALRFPRIVRIRDDKPASEIDTIERVREIYTQMLAREGLN